MALPSDEQRSVGAGLEKRYDEIAALADMTYDRVRKAMAAKLRIRVETLDADRQGRIKIRQSLPVAPPVDFLEKRKRIRRRDLKTLDGTLRESVRIYTLFDRKEISGGELEVRSRHLRRHAEILGTLEQRDQVTAIQAQLEALKAPGSLPYLPGGVSDDADPVPAEPSE